MNLESWDIMTAQAACPAEHRTTGMQEVWAKDNDADRRDPV